MYPTIFQWWPQVAHRVAVLHGGRIIENREIGPVLENPAQDYTRTLIDSVHLIPESSGGFSGVRPDKKTSSPPLLMARGIWASYTKKTWLARMSRASQILRGIDLTIESGEVVALVGESGSGKSTLAKVISGLLPPSAGQLFFAGQPLHKAVRGRKLCQLQKIQIVFQTPDTSLNPVRRIEESISQPLELYFNLTGKKKQARVAELLEMVELPPDYATRYPSELSGGEKQRVALARAFGAEPELILCDEVLSALDTVVGKAILRLIKDLQSRLGVACLFISHDLATVSAIADQVVVLHAGQVCEQGPTQAVFQPPFHPYTRLLMASVPQLRPGWLDDVTATRKLTEKTFSTTAPMDQGCAFRTRCPVSIKGVCDKVTPEAKPVSDNHIIYCHGDIQGLKWENRIDGFQ